MVGIGPQRDRFYCPLGARARPLQHVFNRFGCSLQAEPVPQKISLEEGSIVTFNFLTFYLEWKGVLTEALAWRKTTKTEVKSHSMSNIRGG